MAGKSNVDTADWARAPPPSGPVWRRIATAIYNSEEKSFLGRTPKKWGIVLTFYLVFYAMLALLFALCMGGLFLTLDENRPTHVLDQSLIGSNPGVTSRPPEVLINSTNSDDYIQKLKEFLTPYKNNRWYSSKNECVLEDNYGYPEKPCVFIKLNKIIDWIPEYYDGSEDLPTDMPEDLVEHIMSLPTHQRQQIWISCFEETSNKTMVEYPWGRGLPGKFYPYQNEAGYVSPLVAVRLTPPVDTLTVIRCRAWANNIIYNKSIKEASGYVRISLQIAYDSNNILTE